MLDDLLFVSFGLFILVSLAAQGRDGVFVGRI